MAQVILQTVKCSECRGAGYKRSGYGEVSCLCCHGAGWVLPDSLQRFVARRIADDSMPRYDYTTFYQENMR